jgi:hypothetical protein
MSVTATSLTIMDSYLKNYIPTSTWIINATSTDFSGCEELKAAETGKSHYITGFTVTTASAINISIGAGKSGSALAATLIGPLYFTTGGPGVVNVDFPEPVKIDISTAIDVDASGSGSSCVIIKGFTK